METLAVDRKVGDIISAHEVHWVSATNTVQEAARILSERNTGAVAVKAGDDIVGIFSERDLLRRVVDKGLNPEQIIVGDMMTPKMVHIHLDDELRMAKALMVMNAVRHLLVVDDAHEFVGMLSMRDVIKADISEFSDLITKLNDKYYEQSYKAQWRISSNRVIIQPYVPSG